VVIDSEWRSRPRNPRGDEHAGNHDGKKSDPIDTGRDIEQFMVAAITIAWASARLSSVSLELDRYFPGREFS